ncbi:uncharacterized protein [Diabrotica undecimpunctata]|uniref:uncharacterized protein n=1 Tax=Diabrotica undecimpunctata TaxID=50387 RepID=UPI003B63B71F
MVWSLITTDIPTVHASFRFLWLCDIMSYDTICESEKPCGCKRLFQRNNWNETRTVSISCNKHHHHEESQEEAEQRSNRENEDQRRLEAKRLLREERRLHMKTQIEALTDDVHIKLHQIIKNTDFRRKLIRYLNNGYLDKTLRDLLGFVKKGRFWLAYPNRLLKMEEAYTDVLFGTNVM